MAARNKPAGGISVCMREAADLNEKSPAAQWVGEIANADGIDPRTIRSAGDVMSIARQVQDFNERGEDGNP